MPEGPECHVIADSLRKLLLNKSVVDVAVIAGRYYNSERQLPGLELFQSMLPTKISAVKCKGKLIYIKFGRGRNRIYLFNTLGMTGCWTTDSSQNHLHVKFQIDDDITLYYRDPRHMGTLKFTVNRDKELKTRGPDILSKSSRKLDIVPIYRKYNSKNICWAMMNQKLISGIGNYLKAEILYRCGISPMHNIKDLSDQQLHAIYKWARRLAKKSYKHGGATIYTYINGITNQKGGFTKFMRVYNRQTDKKGRKVVKTQTADKRVTSWVPELQA